MTQNQLAFQRNQIAENELNENMRAHRMQEQLQARDLALQQASLNQKEREAFAKYGSYSYMSPNEDRGGVREYFDLIRRGFEYVINPILSIFTGGGNKK